MRTTGLSVAFPAAAAAAPDRRCTLEAVVPPRGADNPTPADLAAMLARASAGQSARTYQAQACPSAVWREDGTLVVSLAVIVWPSLPDLRYTLHLPDEAEAGETVLYRRIRQWKFWADGAGALLLPWRLEDATLSWQEGVPCMDGRCNAVPAPDLAHEHAQVFVGGDVYGVIVARGAACGYRHEFSVVLGKLDAEGKPQSIDLDDLPVSVTWTDADGEEQEVETTVPVPECAKKLLAACPSGRSVYGGGGDKKQDGGGWEIAYSTCDGSFLGARRRPSSGGQDNG